MYVYLFIHNPIKKPLNHHEITMNPIFHGSLKAPLDPCWGARRQLCLCRALQLSQPQSWNSTCSWAVRHALAHWVQQAISHLSSLRLGLQEDIGPWWQWALLLTLNTYRVSLTCVCPGCTRRAWRFLLLILLFYGVRSIFCILNGCNGLPAPTLAACCSRSGGSCFLEPKR
jgi:hypothetical protein